MKRNKQPNDPFEDLLDLRDNLFVPELKKLVVPGVRDFGQTGTFDTGLFPDFHAFGGAMACSALVSRYEELMRLKESLESHEKISEAISRSNLFSVSHSGLSPYVCITPATVNMLAGGDLPKSLELVLSRMGRMVIEAYGMLAVELDYTMPKSIVSAVDMSEYVAVVERISEKLVVALEKRRVDAANGKKGGEAKARGDTSKKVLKKLNTMSKQLRSVGSGVRAYRDEVLENAGRGVTTKTRANESLITEILNKYGELIQQEAYSGKNRRKAMTDAMRAVVDAKNGYIADFKDEVSLRSELGRERRLWESKYAAQMTDQMVSEPDFSHK